MIPEGIEKANRSQFLTYLDTTPTSSPKWAILGVGINEYGISFNPQVETEKWIIENNARTIHQSNQKQSSVSQKIYKGDPCYEFVNKGIDVLNYKTHILDVDRLNGSEAGYPATMNDVIITITNFLGEDATIEYDIYYDGDGKKGTVTYEGNVPTFAPSV